MTAAARSTERLAGPLPLLGLLADDRTAALLRTLEAGPISPGEMEQRVGVYPHTTVMDRLATFDDLGVVERTALGGMPNASRVELTPAGADVLRIHDALQLRFARQGGVAGRMEDPVPFAFAMGALVDGWYAGLVQDLSIGSVRRSQLRGERSLTYHRLSARLSALERCGLAESETSGRRRYSLSRHGREAMVAVVAALDWERRYRDGAGEGFPRHLAAALGAVAPLCDFAPGTTGVCTLAVEGDGPGQAAGTGVVLEDGLPPAASPLPLDEETLPTAWVRADVDGWLALAAAGEVRALVIGGDAGFARALLDGLYGWLAL